MKVRVKGKPIIDERLNKSVILWRYLDSAKFFDFVLSRTLFFCSGDQFQDKFEGSFTTPIKNAIQKSYRANKIDFSYEKFKKRLREKVFLNCFSLILMNIMIIIHSAGANPCLLWLCTR